MHRAWGLGSQYIALYSSPLMLSLVSSVGHHGRRQSHKRGQSAECLASDGTPGHLGDGAEDHELSLFGRAATNAFRFGAPLSLARTAAALWLARTRAKGANGTPKGGAGVSSDGRRLSDYSDLKAGLRRFSLQAKSMKSLQLASVLGDCDGMEDPTLDHTSLTPPTETQSPVEENKKRPPVRKSSSQYTAMTRRSRGTIV